MSAGNPQAGSQPRSPRGRGAGSNPANRFEPLVVDREEPGPDKVATQLLADTTRSIIARNDSPDVGFETSVNPYRGCEHGCVYCLAGDTPILMADGTTRPLRAIAVGDEIYGTLRDGKQRRCVPTRVLAHWETSKPAYAVILADGTRLVASGDHRFLADGGWKFVTTGDNGGARRPHLTIGDRLLGTGDLAAVARTNGIVGRVVSPLAGLSVRAIEPVGKPVELFDITTVTGDFIADGVVSHNCFARPFHEYLGFSSGLDFETKILVKEQAPELLRRELMSPKWEPQLLVMSGVTDCYQPSERKLEITRRCLGVLAEFRNPVHVITKNHLVTRDVDHLGELASFGAASVTLSITSLDPEVARRMEPRASAPRERLEAVTRLREAGIPCGVNVAPVVPGITDHELPAILAAAKEAGAVWATFMFVRLPHAVKDLFQDWLAEHYPDRKEKVLARIRALRGGKLNEGQFGKRFRAEGVFAEQMQQLFEATARRLDLPRGGPELSTASFRRPGQQLELF
jgi:DNA repair photolyase